MCEQHEKLDRLEGLVYRLMHRNRVGEAHEANRSATSTNGSLESTIPSTSISDVEISGYAPEISHLEKNSTMTATEVEHSFPI